MKAIKCPNCGSEQVKELQKKSMLVWRVIMCF